VTAETGLATVPPEQLALATEKEKPPGDNRLAKLAWRFQYGGR